MHTNDNTWKKLAPRSHRQINSKDPQPSATRAANKATPWRSYVLWLNRTVSMPSKVRGFIMTPSHFLNQDLSGLWLAE